jgi:hypothetical protein
MAIACGPGRTKRRCSICLRGPADKLCDGKTERGTCDAPLCRACAVAGPNPKDASDTLDYCHACAKALSEER